jgi:sugar phosphate isomerase/epimerase
MKIAAMVGAPDLGQPTLAVYSGDLADAFHRLAALGYDGVELMTRDPSRLDLAGIRGLLEETGMSLAGLCTGHVRQEDGLGLVGPDAEVCRQAMARLKRFADAAATFGPGTLVNIGRARGPGDPAGPEATRARAVAAFQELADYARPLDVRWVLEPVNSLQAEYIHSTQDGIAYARWVARPNFSLMLDVFHMNIEDVDIYESIREAGELCRFVHLADNNRHYPGSAHLDFQRIVAALREIGYDGYLSFEIQPWPDPDAAARGAIETLRRHVPHS